MGRKVAFQSSWLEKVVDDIIVQEWCTADPSDPFKAKCITCPAGSHPFGLTFSIKEGFSAVEKHSKSRKHQEHYRPGKDREDDEFGQISIEAALKAQGDLNERQHTETKQLLQGQTLFANFVHTHGLPSSSFTCFGALAEKIFPDSNIAKRWSGSKDGMRQTKGDYFLTHGVYEFHHKNLIKKLKINFFSVNIDESSVNSKSQLDVNVSYIDRENSKAIKENFTIISMEKGTSASEIVEALVDEFESCFIPLKNIMTIVTDGCSTMLGEDGGVHALLRQRLPHLPLWGGCSCHDCSNILKAGVSKLNSNLTSLFSQLHTYLSTSTLHRKREYEEFCRSLGLEPHRIPDFLDVRFRTITSCAEWMEKDDRCLYRWFEKLTKDIEKGTHKDISSSEHFILKEFCSNYLTVRLCNKFIIDVSDPIMTCINHFESEEPKIFERFDVLADFLVKFMAKFLKNGGKKPDKPNFTTKDLLEVDVTDPNLQLSDKDMYLGPKVESFLTELNLTRSSPELKPWLEKVREFYCEALIKAQKYFRPPLSSKVLRACDVFDPKVLFATDLDEVKNKFKTVGGRFSNVIKLVEIPELLDQVSSLHARADVREFARHMTPVQIFSRLVTWRSGKYRLVGILGCAVLSIHNSGSMAERDFSLQNHMVGDPRRNSTSQLRLKARVSMKSKNLNLKHDCFLCQRAKEKKTERLEREDEETIAEEDQVNNNDPLATQYEVENDEEAKRKRTGENHTHCHCPLFKVTDSLLEFMGSGQPSRRFKADQSKRNEARKVDQAVRLQKQKLDRLKYAGDIKKEIIRLKGALKMCNRNIRDKNEVEIGEKSEAEKKEERRRRKEEIAEKRRAAKEALPLLF